MIPGRFELNEQTLTVNKQYIVSYYIQSIFLLKVLVTNGVWHKIFERYLKKALLLSPFAICEMNNCYRSLTLLIGLGWTNKVYKSYKLYVCFSFFLTAICAGSNPQSFMVGEILKM